MIFQVGTWQYIDYSDAGVVVVLQLLCFYGGSIIVVGLVALVLLLMQSFAPLFRLQNLYGKGSRSC